MADSASDKPQQRSAADKERSRQLSRPIGAKDATRSGGRGSRPQGGGGKGQRPQGQRPQGGRGTQGPAGRGGNRDRREAQRTQTRRPPQRARKPQPRYGRSRTAIFTWSAVALVVVIVIVLVVVSTTGSKKGVVYSPKPVPAAVLSDVTHVPTSVFDKVGTGIPGTNYLPTTESGQPALKYTGKPGAFGLFGEFCPYCAADRWSIIAALSRFGTFTGLRTMQSSTTDVFPATQTFTFATATYTSSYMTAKLLEFYGQDKTTGARTELRHPTKAEVKVVDKYDHPATTTSSAGTIPFMDFGNKVFFSGVSFSPGPLQGLTRSTIAAGLRHATDAITKLIIGAANYISAAVCAIDGGKPGSVCSGAGVQAAAKALKLTV